MSFIKFSFRPRLLDSLKGYNGEQFTADLGAGLTVGLVALPLAMAFAIASGLKPEAGLFTAVIAGFIISALGGSKVQIGGPAGAFIVIVYGIVQTHGLANLFIATMMAGVLLFVMGLTGIGSLIRFIPIAIVIGFTNGIAVLIALSQVKDFLGLDIPKVPAEFFAQLDVLWRYAGTADFPTIALSFSALGLIILWPRIAAMLGRRAGTVVADAPESSIAVAAIVGRARLFSRLPGTVVALVLATLTAWLLELPVETIGSRFGGIPQTLPAFALPEFNWQTARNLFGPTVTIALLGAIESLLCARVADAAIGDRHNPNQELMAQGIANFVVPLFGGMPATGTIARTTTNIRAGARSPIAGIVHALVLLAILLVAAPLAEYIPLAALAAVLMFVAWNMGEWREFARLRQFSLVYRTVMLSTFLLTVIIDLSVAVEVGLVLASLFFIYRVSEITRVEPITLPEGMDTPAGRIMAYKLFGSLFFGAVGKIEALLDEKRKRVAVVILEMHQVINLDSTGLDAIEALHRTLGEEGSQLVLAGLTAQPLSIIHRSGFIHDIGEANLVLDMSEALIRARALAAASSPTETAAASSATPNTTSAT